MPAGRRKNKKKLQRYSKMEFITAKHSMPAGDLLALLPAFKKLWKETGKRVVVYQRVNLAYGDLYGAYVGATYSVKDENQVPVTMNTVVFNALRPFMLCQPYIQNFLEWKGEPADYDMDDLRRQDTTMPYGSINRWPFYLWPEMTCDLSQPWLRDHAISFHNLKDKILINRTERYNNMLISYHFLKSYEANVLFLGLPNEYDVFCKQFNLNIQKLEVKNFVDISIAIKSCKLYIGNQSACFQIAEGHKTPRLLEVCKQIPNVIGNGPNFYDCLNQCSLEYYVNILYNK